MKKQIIGNYLSAVFMRSSRVILLTLGWALITPQAHANWLTKLASKAANNQNFKNAAIVALGGQFQGEGGASSAQSPAATLAPASAAAGNQNSASVSAANADGFTNLGQKASRIALYVKGSTWIIYAITAAGALMECSVTASSPGAWSTFPTTGMTAGSFTDVSVGADGTLWCIGAAQEIYAWNSAAKSWFNISGGLTRISVADNNTVWGVNGDGKIYQAILTSNGDSLTASSASALGWTGIAPLAPNITAELVSAGSGDSEVYAQGSNSLIYRYTPTAAAQWSLTSGSGYAIATPASGRCVISGIDYNLYQINADFTNYTMLNSVKGQYYSCAVAADGSMLVLDGSGNVWSKGIPVSGLPAPAASSSSSGGFNISSLSGLLSEVESLAGGSNQQSSAAPASSGSAAPASGLAPAPTPASAPSPSSGFSLSSLGGLLGGAEGQVSQQASSLASTVSQQAATAQAQAEAAAQEAQEEATTATNAVTAQAEAAAQAAAAAQAQATQQVLAAQTQAQQAAVAVQAQAAAQATAAQQSLAAQALAAQQAFAAQQAQAAAQAQAQQAAQAQAQAQAQAAAAGQAQLAAQQQASAASVRSTSGTTSNQGSGNLLANFIVGGTLAVLAPSGSWQVDNNGNAVGQSGTQLAPAGAVAINAQGDLIDSTNASVIAPAGSWSTDSNGNAIATATGNVLATAGNFEQDAQGNLIPGSEEAASSTTPAAEPDDTVAAPASVPAPTPVPAPVYVPAPAPKPVPAPVKVPAPAPKPVPAPVKVPAHAPVPAPAVSSGPPAQGSILAARGQWTVDANGDAVNSKNQSQILAPYGTFGADSRGNLIEQEQSSN